MHPLRRDILFKLVASAADAEGNGDAVAPTGSVALLVLVVEAMVDIDVVAVGMATELDEELPGRMPDALIQ